MAWRTPAVNITCTTDPQTLNGNDKALKLWTTALNADGSLAIPDSWTNPGGGAMQGRRWAGNVTLEEGSTNVGTNSFWRQWIREAPDLPSTPAALRGKRTTGACEFHGGIFLNFKVDAWVRRRYGNGTKGVGLMWPHPGGWYMDGIDIGRAHEHDFWEWFDNNGSRASQIAAVTAGTRARLGDSESPMHWLARRPDNSVTPHIPGHSGQIFMRPHGVEFEDWHHITFLQEVNASGQQQVDLLFDGVRSTSHDATHTWPMTDPKATCQVPQHLSFQSALLVPPGAGTLISQPFEECWIDLAQVQISEWYAGSGPPPANLPPPVPQSPSVADPGTTTARVSWGPAVDPEGAAVTYVLQLAPITGGQTGTIGSWTTVGPADGIVGTTYLLTGLTAGSPYALRIAAQDERGLAGRSGYSGSYRFTTAATGGTRPVAGMTITGTGDNAGVTIVGGGTYRAIGGFSGAVTDTGSSGTLSRRTIDPGDGSGQTYSSASSPGVPGWAHTWNGDGTYTVTLSVTDTSQTPEQSDSITATIVITQDAGDTSGPNLQLPLVKAGHVEEVRAEDVNLAYRTLDVLAGGGSTLMSTDPKTVVQSSQGEGLDYPWYVRYADGSQDGGDGYSPPVPVLGVGGVPYALSNPPAPPAPPALRTASAFAPVIAKSDSAASATVTAPTTLIAGTTLMWVIAARTAAAAPAYTGWTLDSASNAAGGDATWVYRRDLTTQAVADGIKGTTLTVALGATTNYGSVLLGFNNSLGVVSSRLGTNANIYGSTHPAPGTETTTPAVATSDGDQLIVVVHSGRANTTAARTWTAADGTDVLAEVHTGSTTANNMHLLVSTYRTGEVGTVPVKTATSGGGVASVGGQYVLGVSQSMVPPANAASFNAMFEHVAATTGWRAADGGWSVNHPSDGSALLLFGDTAVVDATSTRRLVHGSALIWRGSTISRASGDTSWIPDASDGTWYWPGPAVMDNGKLYVLAGHHATVPGGWSDLGVDFAEFDWPAGRSPAFSRIVPSPSSTTGGVRWNAGFCVSGGYVYAFGTTAPTGFGRQVYVARVTQGSLVDLTAWRYWDGSAWVTNKANAALVMTGPEDAFSVDQLPDGSFRMVSKFDGPIGGNASSWTAPAPTGPWSSATTLFPAAFSNWDQHYLVHAHYNLPRVGGQVLVSVSHNRSCRPNADDTACQVDGSGNPVAAQLGDIWDHPEWFRVTFSTIPA